MYGYIIKYTKYFVYSFGDKQEHLEGSYASDFRLVIQNCK